MTAATSGELLSQYRERSLFIGRATISDFVIEQAAKTVVDVGFDYVARADAPMMFSALVTAYDHSSLSGEPLPISAEHSDSVVYADAEVNYAMRFWHDVNHVRRKLTFDLVDEMELSLWHLAVLEHEGFSSDTLVWQLLHADLIGAVYVMALSRRFPLDQLRFAEGCIPGGCDAGMLAELRRQS